jgi:hypothetical protein
MKEWRKLVWSGYRCFINLRLSDLTFAGVKRSEPYLYLTKPDPKRKEIIIKFKKDKSGAV